MNQQVAPLTDHEFVQFQRFIHEAAGIALSDAKKPLVSGRLAKRLHHLQYDGSTTAVQQQYISSMLATQTEQMQCTCGA